MERVHEARTDLRISITAFVQGGDVIDRLTELGGRITIAAAIALHTARTRFERWLELQGERTQLVVRFGTGPQMPFSIRRPLDDVILRAPAEREEGPVE